MKILKKLIWVALAIEIIVLLVVVINSNVDNMTCQKARFMILIPDGPSPDKTVLPKRLSHFHTVKSQKPARK